MAHCAVSLARICLRDATRVSMPPRRFHTGPSSWTGRAIISTSVGLTPKPPPCSRCTDHAGKGTWPGASRHGVEPSPARLRTSGPRRLGGSAAAPRARSGDRRKRTRFRASRYGDGPHRPRQPAPGSGGLYEGAAALRARTGDLRKGARRRAARPKRLPSGKPPSPHTTRLLDRITPGPRTAPTSLSTRSTHLAAQRMQRRCRRGMGSRVLTTLSPHERP